MLSFSSALVLSLYTNAQVQWEIAGLSLLDKSPEAALKDSHRSLFPRRYFEPAGAGAGKAQERLDMTASEIF